MRVLTYCQSYQSTTSSRMPIHQWRRSGHAGPSLQTAVFSRCSYRNLPRATYFHAISTLGPGPGPGRPCCLKGEPEAATGTAHGPCDLHGNADSRSPRIGRATLAGPRLCKISVWASHCYKALVKSLQSGRCDAVCSCRLGLCLKNYGRPAHAHVHGACTYLLRIRLPPNCQSAPRRGPASPPTRRVPLAKRLHWKCFGFDVHSACDTAGPRADGVTRSGG